MEVIQVTTSRFYQEIDGFDMNINVHYWKGGKLAASVDQFLDDLCAILFQVDIWGKPKM